MGWLADTFDAVTGNVFDVNNEGGGISGWAGDVAGATGIEAVYDAAIGLLTPDLPDFSNANNEGILLNKQSNVAYIPVVYGARRLGGTIVFKGVSGDSNEFYHIVLVLCEGEIEAIDDVYIDDILSTDSQYTGLVTITKYLGTDTQAADADLVSSFTEWTTAHQLKGTAYVHVKLQYDNNIFRGNPKILCDIRGKKVLDKRTSPETTAYSTNPALCLRDYLTNARYGKGLPDSAIDDTAFNLAATECEVQITESTSSPQVQINQFACNAVVNTGNQIKDNVTLLRQTCRGYLPYYAGTYSLVIDKDETPTFTFNTTNIIGNWSIIGQTKRSRFNRVKAKFPNPNRDWQDDIAPFDSSTYRTNDNNSLLEKSVDLPFETNFYRAYRHAQFIANRSRHGINIGFTATIAALRVEIGEVVYLTHATPGWTNKTFRVIGLDLLSSGNVGIELAEHDSNVYTFATAAQIDAAPTTNLPNPFTVLPPTSLTLDSSESRVILATNGSLVSRIYATWTTPSDIYVVGYEIEFKLSSESTWVPAAVVSNKDEAHAYIAPVKDSVNYDVRVRAVNSLDYKSTWETVTAHNVIGKTTPPTDVNTFTVLRMADGTREFRWTHLTIPVDLAGYKIKYKLGIPSPAYTWDDLDEIHTGYLLASPFETNQLAAGTYTIAIKAVDTSGNESTNALFITSTLGDPRLKASLLTKDEMLDGWPGTKTNCWLDNNVNHLLATDTLDWASFATTSPQTTWADWTTWARTPNSPIYYTTDIIDVGISTTYTPLITVSGVGTILVEERHSDGDTSPWTWSSYATVLGQVSARYIQFRVTITSATPTAELHQMYINLDAEIIDEYINDLDTSTIAESPTVVGDFRLPLTKSYALITSVQIALQNTGGGWSWELIDKSTSLGPRIKIYNSTPALADATIDAVIKGVAA